MYIDKNVFDCQFLFRYHVAPEYKITQKVCTPEPLREPGFNGIEHVGEKAPILAEESNRHSHQFKKDSDRRSAL
jgi:hypothetical protein